MKGRRLCFNRFKKPEALLYYLPLVFGKTISCLMMATSLGL
jgi:hypothetical protein